jgi:pSer/pThr/pTyr-binding forkhead associated (FHA) protein
VAQGECRAGAGSVSGTFGNGKKVARQSLRPGDSIRLGTTTQRAAAVRAQAAPRLPDGLTALVYTGTIQ